MAFKPVLMHCIDDVCDHYSPYDAAHGGVECSWKSLRRNGLKILFERIAMCKWASLPYPGGGSACILQQCAVTRDDDAVCL